MKVAMADSSNRYCQRLDIPVPSVEAAAKQRDVGLSHLMVVALLERGWPMTLDEIAARLERAALPPRFAKDNLRAALRAAWHGRPPIVRDTDDRLALDLLFSEWWRLLLDIGGPPARVVRQPTPEFRLPSDDVPLSGEEVDAAFKERSLVVYSGIRQAAAILEAAGAPLTLQEINARLAQLSSDGAVIREESLSAWRSDLVLVEPGGTLRINPASAAIPALRRDIRRKAFARLRVEAEHARFDADRPAFEQARDATERRDMEQAGATRRALVHIVPGNGRALAVAVIDAQARRLRILTGEELREIGSTLEAFDLLAGLDLRPSLRALGLDAERWLLAELRPTDRTHHPTYHTRVPVTLEAIIRATVRGRKMPAGPDQWQRLFEKGRDDAIRKRLAADAETLFALYEYGALQGGVRLRARTGDHLLEVSWGMRGDPDIHSILAAAKRAWAPLDAMVGSPPGLADPWTHAVRMDIVEEDWPRLFVRTADHVMEVDAHDLFALRVATPAAAAAVRPRGTFPFDDRSCQLKVTLVGIEPPIWRRLVVPAWTTLDRLHMMLQAALGWTNSHLHVFEIDGERIGIPYDLEYLVDTYTRSGRIVHLIDVVDRGWRQFIYEYDFGDSWRHVVEIEEVRDSDPEDRTRCLEGARACPPEDCGGIGGYEQLLEVLFDPAHEEFDELRAWAGDFEPERFDIRAANEHLGQIRWWAPT
jgi:hypothetical protein